MKSGVKECKREKFSQLESLKPRNVPKATYEDQQAWDLWQVIVCICIVSIARNVSTSHTYSIVPIGNLYNNELPLLAFFGQEVKRVFYVQATSCVLVTSTNDKVSCSWTFDFMEWMWCARWCKANCFAFFYYNDHAQLALCKAMWGWLLYFAIIQW